MAFPIIHKLANGHEPRFLLGTVQVNRSVINKPGKQFIITYPAYVFFEPSSPLSIFRLVPRNMASVMAAL